MASANVDLVRSIYARWERGDYSSSDWAHPDIEWVVADGPAPGSWRGHAGMAQGWRDFLTAWHEFRVKGDDYLPLDSERVLVMASFAGRGKASGLDLVDAEGAQALWMDDGRVTRSVIYFDRDQALADLGLRPGGPPSAEENVAAARRIYEEFARREHEFTFQVFDEEVAFDARRLGVPELGRVYHGHEGVREFWRAWLEAWEDVDLIDGPHFRANGNQVVQWHRQLLVGKGSGVRLEQEAGFVYTFENGRILRIALFLSRDEALRAIGLVP